MSFRTRIFLPSVALVSLAFLVACGSTYNRPVPPPTGGFSKSNLNGTYVFSVIGADVNFNFLAIAGTITADGNGNLTGGTFDVINPNNVGIATGVAISGNSTYTVTADGRGTANIGAYAFDFVLTSSEHGLITVFDSGDTGSGTLDLQTGASQAQLAQSYALNLTGIDGNLNPMSSLAGFTLNNAGTMSNGIQDINDFQTALAQLTLSGSLTAGAAATDPATATLVTQTTLDTLTFDVFAIDANHLKFIETDGVAGLVGDAFPQLTSIPAGTNVFTAAGLDFTGTQPVPFVAGGFLVTGGGSVSSTSTEDINDAGTVTQNTFSGLYTALNKGRSTFTLVGFNNTGLSGTTVFAAYPSTGGLQLLEMDGLGITGGVAVPQSSTALASGQGYGLNLTGQNSNGEEDDIAEFTNNNGSFSGLVDFNDQGSLTSDRVFTGTYTADSGNTGRGQITSNSFSLISYVVDSSTTMFIEQDSNQVGLGAFQIQTASAKSNLVAQHLSALKIRPGAKAKKLLKRK